MKIEEITSIARIKRRYKTGEEPVWVECSDLHNYVCKYMRSEAGAYKLVCELFGGSFAKAWGIVTPEIRFVKIRSCDWPHYSSINFSAPAIGSRFISSAYDVTSISYGMIPRTERIAKQLLTIAMFDLWICNEDRNYNNSNLMFDLEGHSLVAIDHGCVFNTASFELDLALLTSNETILQSNLSKHLFRGVNDSDLLVWVDEVVSSFPRHINKGKEIINEVLNDVPDAWGVSEKVIMNKIEQLFDTQWCQLCLKEYTGIIKDLNDE